MERRVFPANGGALQSSFSGGLVRSQSSTPALASQTSGLDNKLKKIADSLDPSDLDDRGKHFIEWWRSRTKYLLHNHFLGGMYQMILLVLSVVSALEYIYDTYVSAYKSNQVGQLQAVMTNLELVLAGIFAFDWLLSFFLADDRLSFVVSFYSIIDIFTVVATFSTFNEECPAFERGISVEEFVHYVLCGLVTTRILRALRIQSRFLLIEDEVQRALASMGLNIAMMILFNAALMQYLEPDQELDFHTWTYYMLVTVTTVGYGDITPRTILGRFAAMGMIGFAIITVPDMTNQLLEKMASQSVYARAKYIARTGRSQHVLICGDSSSSSLMEFFQELFHEDHEMENLQAVVLQPGLPNAEMQMILKDPAYQLSVTYLEGSPLRDKDLNRAQAERAKAVFLLTNKFSAFPDEEDAKIILQQFSIQRYLRLYAPNTFKRSLFCMQLIRPENKRHLVTAGGVSHTNTASTGGGGSLWRGQSQGSTGDASSSGASGHGGGGNTNLVVCLNEIKMGVIAKAIIFPGANTLIMNLLSSFADDSMPSSGNVNGQSGNNSQFYANFQRRQQQQEGSLWNQLTGGLFGDSDSHSPASLLGSGSGGNRYLDGIETLEEDEDASDWIGEYQRGCDWEIYTTELSPSFSGAVFANLSEVLYLRFGIVLFGLEVEDLRRDSKGNSGPKLLLNPADLVIPSHEEARVTAFVIAKNKAQSDLSFSGSTGGGMSASDAEAVVGQHFTHLSVLAGSLTSNAGSTAQSSVQRLSVPHRPAVFGIPGGGNSTNSSPTRSQQQGGVQFQDGDGKDGSEKIGSKDKLAWQALLRRHDGEKSAETLQEEMQKLEDQHIKEHYYCRTDYAMELNDAVVKTSIMESKPFIDNHIIVIGKALSNLYDLIRPLRAKTLGTLKHIVILYPGDFPLAVWQRISIFESIWIIRGSPLEEADIRRCGIFKAKQVIMLADATALGRGGRAGREGEVGKAHSDDSDSLVDADAIFCYQAVKRLNEAANVVVEIVRQSNVTYLDPETGLNSSEIDYKFSPQFASGALFTTSLLDTLLCQAFYNTKIVEVINKFVGFGVDTDPHHHHHSKHGGTQASSPQGRVSPFGGNSRTATAPSNAQSSGSGFSTKHLLSSALYQIPVLVEGLESRTYGALYSVLAKKKLIPLGILRGVFANTKSGSKNNKMPYVFTNPPKDTELFSCDKVFVLSQTPVKIVKSTGNDDGTSGSSINTLPQTVTQMLRQRQKTTEDVAQMLSHLEEELQKVHSEQRENLDLQVSCLQEHVQTQLQQLTCQVEATSHTAQQLSQQIHLLTQYIVDHNGNNASGSSNRGVSFADSRLSNNSLAQSPPAILSPNHSSRRPSVLGGPTISRNLSQSGEPSSTGTPSISTRKRGQSDARSQQGSPTTLRGNQGSGKLSGNRPRGQSAHY